MMIRRFDGVVGGVSAACEIVSVRPPATIVPVRAALVVFGAVVKVIVPDPVPVLVTVIHDAVVVALQLHPVPAVMPTDPVPPAAGAVAVLVESV
jgi:hypothetical protein